MTTNFLLFGVPGVGELLVILAIILVLFGAKRLPGLARSLGRSLGEFKKGREEGEKSDDQRQDDQADESTDNKS